jgi:hypothetical protein
VTPEPGDEAPPTPESPAESTVADDGADPDELTDAGAGPDQLAEAQAAIEDARRRVAEVPAEVVVTNHVMGLYELAAIHLSSEQPDLRAAALAIDAVACLVDGLGDRLGAEAPTMRDALGNIRLAFVEIKSRQMSSST